MSNENKQFADQSPDPTQQFISAVDSINFYNKRNAGIGLGIGALLGGITSESPIDMQEHLDRTATRRDMERELIHMIQVDELAEMGIKVFDAQAAGVKEFVKPSEDEGEMPSGLMALLDDSDKLAITLGALEPSDDPQAGVNQCLEVIFRNAAGLVRASRRDWGEDTRARDAGRYIADKQLDIALELLPVLTSKGFDRSAPVGELAEFAVRRDAGMLDEYLGARDRNLLAPPNSYGPASWHEDITAQRLTENWDTGLSYLKSLRDNHSPFYEELFNSLRHDFEISHDAVMARAEGNALFDSHRPVIDQVNAQWEKDFALENSFYLAQKAEQEGKQ